MAVSSRSSSTVAAYRRRQDRPLEAIYAERLGWRERLRWRRARTARWLKEFPPVLGGVRPHADRDLGAGVLGLPIAVAGLGRVLWIDRAGFGKRGGCMIGMT